jgi:hypothetical protein
MEENKFNKPVIRRCEYCGSDYHVKPGLSNVKNLFRKPSWNEWFILALLVMVMIGAYFYWHDIQSCRSVLTNLSSICRDYNKVNNSYSGWTMNFSSIQNISLNTEMKNAEDQINSMQLYPNGS